jgi:hypothetical protein
METRLAHALEVESGSHGCEKLETHRGGALLVETAAFVAATERSVLSQANEHEALFGCHLAVCKYDVAGNEACHRCDPAPCICHLWMCICRHLCICRHGGCGNVNDGDRWQEIGFEVLRSEERMCLPKAVPAGSCLRAHGESEDGRIRRGRVAQRCYRDTWAAGPGHDRGPGPGHDRDHDHGRGHGHVRDHGSGHGGHRRPYHVA